MTKLILERVPRYSIPKAALTIEPLSTRSFKLFLWLIVALIIVIISGFLLAIIYVLSKDDKVGMRRQAAVYFVRGDPMEVGESEIATSNPAVVNVLTQNPLQSNICQSQFLCQSNSKCIPNDLVCNRFFDCPKGEDEQNCSCFENSEYHCRMYRCLSRHFICDGIADCHNEVDENKILCQNSKEDWCNANGGFWCSVSKMCIERERKCDFSYDCDSGDKSDEMNCLTLSRNKPPRWSFNDQSLHICTDNWKYFDDELCERAGFDESVGNVRGTLETKPKSVLNVDSHPSQTDSKKKFARVGNYCKKYLLDLKCKKRNCGTTSNDFLTPSTYGDQNVRSLKTWPWHAIVKHFYDGDNITHVTKCGGTLIDHNWILTAAHCLIRLDDDSSALGKIQHSNVTVTLGVVDPKHVERGEEIYSRTVHIHPSLDENYRHDVALIKLQRSVSNRDTISPICLFPKKRQDDLFNKRLCFVTGTGLVLSNGSSSGRLQQIRVVINSCKKYISDSHRPESFCTFSFIDPLLRNTCLEEGGGPLSCFDEVHQRWEVVGVASPWGTKSIMDRCKVGEFIRVDEYESWIKSILHNNLVHH